VPQDRAAAEAENRGVGDTAGAAKRWPNTPTRPERRSRRPCAEIYGLDILARDIEDEHTNTTRFLIMTADKTRASPFTTPCITSFTFKVRNLPAALYKAMAASRPTASTSPSWRAT
jgi:prephenate dehydratase